MTKRDFKTIYCRYSGMPLPSYADFPQLPVDFDAHLLMRIPYHLLIDEIEKRKVLTDRQQRLLFIALLKSTDLLVFECPAIPTDRTIETEFQRLIAITYYINSHRTFYLRFPKYKVSKQNPSISNITHVLNSWFDVKNKNTWTAQDRKDLRESEAFEELETKVTQAILKHKPLTPIFNKHLIRWALETSEAPLGMHIKWAKIFLTKEDKMCKMCIGKKVLLNPLSHQMEECPNCDGTGRVSDIDKLSFKSVQELRNFMMDSLPEETHYESTRKMAILRHLARKVQQIKLLHAAFGMELLTDDVPKTAEQKAKGFLAEEPTRDKFKSALDYLRALATFRAAQDVIEIEPLNSEDEFPDNPELDISLKDDDAEQGEDDE